MKPDPDIELLRHKHCGLIGDLPVGWMDVVVGNFQTKTIIGKSGIILHGIPSDMRNWLQENLAGDFRWRVLQAPSSHSITPVKFFFELDEDATLFKLRWI